MKQNFSQRLEMQIPQENTYTGLDNMHGNELELNDFLNKHFKFPSNNLNEIKKFIDADNKMKNIISDLPEIITDKLDYTHISLDFMKETDPNEKILEIIIYSELNDDLLLKKEDLISDGIIDDYPQPMNEYIILVESYVK